MHGWWVGQGEYVKCINYVNAKINFNLQDSLPLSDNLVSTQVENTENNNQKTGCGRDGQKMCWSIIFSGALLHY